jgi:hypothetical protein
VCAAVSGLEERDLSQTAIVVQGIVTADGSLELAEKLNVPAGRVQVVIQPLQAVSSEGFSQRMETMWADQKTRGHIPRSVEEVETERQAFREEMEEEIQQAIRLQEECRKSPMHAEQPEEAGE